MNHFIQDIPKKGILKSVIFWWVEKRIREIEAFSVFSAEIQENQRVYLIEAAKETNFGKQHFFADIRSYEDFANQIPVLSYEDFEPYISKTLRGETNVIWSKKINWFAKSSGTTNAKSKYIPLTTESLRGCHYKGGKDMFALYAKNHSETKIFDCMNLRLGGSISLNQQFNYAVGDLSAVMIKNLPLWAEIKSVPSKKISLMSSWEEKLPSIIQSIKTKNVGSITGVPSWVFILLNALLKDSGKDYLNEIWQNIEVFFHGGISFLPYIDSYDHLFSKKINYTEVYNASEGFFAIQDTPSTENGMLLMLDYGVFYEFIPMDNYSPNHAIPLWQVELEKNYALVISTNGGLWRYLIGDTVKFISKNPYRIVITGRTQLYINAFGEELMIGNTETAIKLASEQTDCVVKEYTAAPRFMSKKECGCHEWIIEFHKKPNDFSRFREILDTTLKNINSDYEAKRHQDITLSKPIIHIAKDNLFYDWLRSKNKLGGQNKVPRLSNDRKYIDELLTRNQM